VGASSFRGEVRRSLVRGLAVGVVVDIVVVVGRWELVGALREVAELLCRFLVGGRALGWVGRGMLVRVARRVFGRVLVKLDSVGSVVGWSMSLDGIFLRWRRWCWRGLWRVAWLEEVVRRMCPLAVGVKAFCILFLDVLCCNTGCRNQNQIRVVLL
jgi:hypothetical protein